MAEPFAPIRGSKEQEEYWLKRFEGAIPLLNIPTDYKRPLNGVLRGTSMLCNQRSVIYPN